MSPPGHGKGALPGASSAHQNHCARKVPLPTEQGNFFPEIVERLQRAGVKHEFRRAANEVTLQCVWCGGKLSLEIEKQFHFCFNDGPRCPVNRMEFAAVVAGVLRGGT